MESQLVTARKEHVCEGCGLTIEPGEKYWRHRWYPSEWDGDGYGLWKMDEHCEKVCQKILDWRDRDEGIDPSQDVPEYWSEKWTEWGIGDEHDILTSVRHIKHCQSISDERRANRGLVVLGIKLDRYAGNILNREDILREVSA